MRFGYENLFDSVDTKLKLPHRYKPEACDDTYGGSLKVCSHRRHSLFSYSGFMGESDFLHGSDDHAPNGSTMNHTGSSKTDSVMNYSQPSKSDLSQAPQSVPSKRRIEPDGCIFVGAFDRLSSEDLHNLEEIYRKRNGKRPSKREIKLYSSVHGIPQCKIKRWFEAKLGVNQDRDDQPVKQHILMNLATPSTTALSNYVSICPKADSDPEVSSMLWELEENVNQMEEINTSIGNFIGGLLN